MERKIQSSVCQGRCSEHRLGAAGGEGAGRGRGSIVTMVEMTREDFEKAVDDAIDAVPEELLDLIDNCVILIEDEPEGEDKDLLGLYDGVALTDRGDLWGGELPDRILIYMNPTLRMCEDVEDVRDEVAITVVHEIAHHFGIDDARLHELGWD
ncbi:metallopeptidase family protein [Demequina mangrovi]